MEVSIADTGGLPEGYLLSVRAGSTRRQAPLPLTEPLRFPHLPFNARNFKVDVLKVLGNAKLDIEAQKEVESYTLNIDVGDNVGRVAMGLTVREDPTLAGKRTAELKQANTRLEDSGEMGKAVQDTRDYAKEHNIPNVVQEMLQRVLRERPAAPFSAMAAYLNRLAVEMGEVQPPDQERLQLEADHHRLQTERSQLLLELARLEEEANRQN